MQRGLLVFFGTAFLLIAFWVIWARTGVNFANQNLMWQGGNVESAAQWGDTFGAFNAFFGALGFAAVLGTLWTQAAALKEQKQDLYRQRFETTFFQLLVMIRQAREEVRFLHSPEYLARFTSLSTEKTGHAAFRAAYREMRYWLQRRRRSRQPIDREVLAEIYAEKIHKRFESTFGAYYRLLYGSLDRLRRDKVLSANEKADFGNLIRGQFTSFEAVLAGCNGLNSFAKDFDEIILEFRLLKYARHGMVRDRLEDYYPASAFLGRGDGLPSPSEEVDRETDDDEDL